MHPGEELADHLEGGAVAGFVAQRLSVAAMACRAGPPCRMPRGLPDARDSQRPFGARCAPPLIGASR